MMFLAKEIYRILTETTSHNFSDKAAVGEIALDHDLEEVLTGDLSSLLKRALEGIQPGIYKQAVDQLCIDFSDEAQEVLEQIEAKKRAAQGSIIEFCLKFADILEALLYAMDYAVGARRDSAIKDIAEQMILKWQAAELSWPKMSWANLYQFVFELVPEHCPPPKTIMVECAEPTFVSAYPRDGED